MVIYSKEYLKLGNKIIINLTPEVNGGYNKSND